ncbi:MAG: anaerobic sulfatase maturase [Armatimonadetes bacterium]|nr:anaerobic sulfatase maturase [Armatimonadota bacterium]
MATASRDFQVFAKPAGPACNLACHYCYYLEKEQLFPGDMPLKMPDDLLELYIAQHIEASPGPVIRFSWHGGEPTILGLDYFRRIVAIQRRHTPAGRRIENGIQTNGTLLNEDWCRFLADENFAVGISIDGPRELHDLHRVTRDGESAWERTMRGYELLRSHGVDCDVLCVVGAHNAVHPTRVYRFLKSIGARYLTFLPLVVRQPDSGTGASALSVPPAAWGEFLCTIHEEWQRQDIGKVGIQIFDEAVRPALGQDHALCIFSRKCGNIPVVEHNGDFYSCDHFVDPEHLVGNIREQPLVELLESPAQRAFGRAKSSTLPRYCRDCPVLEMCNGGCPKDRFLLTPDGEPGLNYLCEGYRRFFTSLRPFLTALATLRRRQLALKEPTPEDDRRAEPRRNDPCPCGSGRKYKACCMRK